MLKNTFLHIPSIGSKMEELLWSKGILDWDEACKIDSIKGVSKNKINLIKEHISISKDKVDTFEVNYFTDGMKPGEHWRIFPTFREKTAFLDIETTGLYPEYDEITTIALYSNNTIKHYVSGNNLNDFKKDIEDYKVLVTYNGKNFDIPFIEKTFGIHLNHAHIDLRWVLSSLGYTGGLKSIERQLGIGREGLEEVDGAFAPELWRYYKKNKKRNVKALETLIAYNMVDTLNLEKLLVEAYNKKVEDTPFKTSNIISTPIQSDIPFKPDTETIKKVLRSYF